MFYLEGDSTDEEKKVCEGLLSETEGVYHGKAPAGILVSYLHQCPSLCLLAGSVCSLEGRGGDTPQKKMANAFSLENVTSSRILLTFNVTFNRNIWYLFSLIHATPSLYSSLFSLFLY